MEQPAVTILNANRIMAISTVRPDGWPQTTVVGYANEGFDLFFLIFRASQKYANIQKDNRISIAVAPEPEKLEQLRAVYAAAFAEEITDSRDRDDAWHRLMERHSYLAGFKIPEAEQAAFMRAKCRHISYLDYSVRLGHREQLTIDDKGLVTKASQSQDHWPSTVAEAFESQGMGVAPKE